MSTAASWLMIFFHFAMPVYFMDVDQFSDDLELVDVAEYSAPVWPGYDFDLGMDLHRGDNALRLALAWGSLTLESSEDGRLASFEEGYFTFLLGLKHRFGKHFALIAGSGIGMGGYDYDAHGETWDGRARRGYYLATPELAAELTFKRFGLGVSGRYHAIFGNAGDTYYGDMGHEDQGDFDLSRTALRVYLIICGSSRN